MSKQKCSCPLLTNVLATAMSIIFHRKFVIIVFLFKKLQYNNHCSIN